MDPSSAAAPCNRNKRRNIASTAHDDAKRFKAAQEGEETLECGRSCHPARISVLHEHLQRPIAANELTELLHYAALGKSGGVKQPSWCRLRHQRRIESVNVVIVEGLTQSLFYKHYLTLRHLRTNYSTRVTFTPSSADLASGIFSSEVPPSDALSLSQRQAESSQSHKALLSHPVIGKFGTQRRGLTEYVVTQEDMIRKHFPVKGMPGFEEYVSTDSVDCVTDSSPLYGIDCEMCLTEKGNELTRVSLVDSDGSCVMDELVKPHNPILNYLTRFSGITAAMLGPITTSLRDVQAKLRTVLPSDAVLVGHSINVDLMALKLIHRHVIDTSLLYRREFGQKFKLKVLAEAVLKKQIQTEEQRGHNPTEDALAALELAQYFIKTGPRQVVERHQEELWGYTIEEETTDCPPAPTPSHRFADVLQTLGRSVVFIGKRSDIALDVSNQRWYGSDKEVLASFRRQTNCPFLSVLQFPSFSDHLEKFHPHQEQRHHHHHRACASLRDLCAVFAGPFPAGFTERDVRRLFSCCGPVQKVKMLNTTVRVHAEVTFQLLEGAMLALKTLNGLHVHGQSIKVQRPVHESTLDLDLTLDAMIVDILNRNNLYAVKLKSNVAESVNNSPKINGFAQAATANRLPAAATANGAGSQLTAGEAKLTEESAREAFAGFGPVERVALPGRAGRRHTHARIQFESSEGKHAALSSSADLWKQNFVVCPALTPPHLPSWVSMTTPAPAVDPDMEAAESEERTRMCATSQDQEVDLIMRKLDRRFQKLFRSLPDGTLSVVVLLGHTSAQGHIPGLCLMEVKQAS